jgi:hypothetical protein
MEGGTDGTLASTGQKFFSCQPGKGLYYPLDNLQPDKGSSNYCKYPMHNNIIIVSPRSEVALVDYFEGCHR